MIKILKAYFKQHYIFRQHIRYLSRKSGNTDFPRIKLWKQNHLWYCRIFSFEKSCLCQNINRYMARQQAMEDYIKLLNDGKLIQLPQQIMCELPSDFIDIPMWTRPFYKSEYENLFTNLFEQDK